MDRKLSVQSTDYGMGTFMTHKAFGKYAEEALNGVRAEAVRLEGLLSRFLPGSEISRINNSAGMKCEKLSEETFEVLSCAVGFSRYSGGLFDITIGPLAVLWNSGKDKSKVPEDSKIRQVLPLIDYTGLSLDPDKKTARLRKAGQSIDLGGIGKGFAGDKFLEVFRKYEIASAFTNIGGNVVVSGAKPDGSPWHVGIQHPRQENSLVGFVSVTDKAVVTSGDYQRYFIGCNGKRHHHILDSRTGYPAESGLVSATAVTDSSITADALSTVLFIAGKDKGHELLKSFPGTDAIFIDINLKVYITRGLKDSFKAFEGVKIEILN